MSNHAHGAAYKVAAASFLFDTGFCTNRKVVAYMVPIHGFFNVALPGWKLGVVVLRVSNTY